MNRVGITNPVIYRVLFVVSGTMLVTYVFYRLSESRMEFTICLAGYVARMVVVIVDCFTNIPIFIDGGDSETFWDLSRGIEHGAYEPNAYTHVLGKVYLFISQDRVLAQYINVLCAAFVVLLMFWLFREYNAQWGTRYLVLLFVSLMPVLICLQAVLLRESMMLLLITLSKALSPIETTELEIVTFLSVVRSSNALFGIAVAVFAIWITYSRKRKANNHIYIIILGIIMGGLIGVALYWGKMGDLHIPYLTGDLTLETITNKPFEPGGSDYLVGINVENWFSFLLWSMIRSLYFWISPLPMDFRGIVDGAGFIFDSVPLITMIVITIRTYMKQKNPESLVFIIGIALSTVLYAWGTSNAGTAMRHRAIMYSLIAVLYCINSKRLKCGSE